MRTIEKNMIYAINNERNFTCGNTSVRVEKENECTTISVYLHNNKIYEKVRDNKTRKENVYFSLCGWNTTTTRSRLNALDINVSQRNFMPYAFGKEISSYKTYNLNEF